MCVFVCVREGVCRRVLEARAMAQRAEHAMQEVEESQTMTRAMIQANSLPSSVDIGLFLSVL